MNATECDNCRRLGPLPAPGWIVAMVIAKQEQSFLSMLSGGGSPGAEVAGTFCGWRCVAEYAAARSLIPEAGS